MSKLLLRLHSLVSRKAKDRYEKLLEQQLHGDVCKKAQRFRDREVKDLVDSGLAKQVGDKLILTAKLATYNISGSADDYSDVPDQGGIEVTSEGDITENQLQELIALHQTPEIKDSRYRRNEALPHQVEHAKPDDFDFVIVKKTSEGDEVECTDADALLYFSKRNHR